VLYSFYNGTKKIRFRPTSDTERGAYRVTSLPQKRAVDQERRRLLLSSARFLASYTDTHEAWGKFRSKAKIRQLTYQVRVPLSLLQCPGFGGRSATSPRLATVRGRPKGVGHEPSILGRLASGGRDALALRLYLTMLAVDMFASDMVQDIPLMPPPDDPSAISWATLTHVSRSVRHKTKAQRRNKSLSGEELRRTQRSRLKDAVDLLRSMGLVSIVSGPRGTVAGLKLSAIPPDVPVTERAGCSDVWLPITYWVNGWNAVLWGDDIINFLAFCSLPESDVFGLPVTVADGGTRYIDKTTRPPIGDGSEVTKMVPTGEKARWMSHSRRVNQFGIHDVRYSKRDDLRSFRLIKLVTSPSRPIPRQDDDLDWLLDLLPPSEPSAASEPGTPFVVLDSQPGPLTVGGYQVHLDNLSNDGRTAVTRAFENVSARLPT